MSGGSRVGGKAVAALAILVAAVAFGAVERKPEPGWPQWRGPASTGVVLAGDPPIRFSATENLRWAVEIPGRGLSAPIVAGDRVFLTTAVPHGPVEAAAGRHVDGAHDNVEPEQRHEFVVMALARADGAVLWRRTVRDERPHEGAHVTGSWASASPVTDGRRVWAHFGSRGLYALDVNGTVLWEKDLGDMEIFHAHGEGSSPALWGETLVVNWDHQGESFLVALDATTGAERWRVARDEITSWSTPLIVEHAGRAQVVVAATKRVRGYDLATGAQLWEAAGLSRNVVATPVSVAGLVFAGNSYDGRALLAIRLEGAAGDITGTDRIAWTRDRDTPYVPSPLVWDDALCFVKHLGPVFTCVDPRTGATLAGPRRLDGIDGVFASPVGVEDRLYVVGKNGATAVLRRGGAFEPLALNRLDDTFEASPAIAGDELYLRGERRLYCIAPPPRSAN